MACTWYFLMYHDTYGIATLVWWYILHNEVANKTQAYSLHHWFPTWGPHQGQIWIFFTLLEKLSGGQSGSNLSRLLVKFVILFIFLISMKLFIILLKKLFFSSSVNWSPSVASISVFCVVGGRGFVYFWFRSCHLNSSMCSSKPARNSTGKMPVWNFYNYAPLTSPHLQQLFSLCLQPQDLNLTFIT